MSLTQKSGHADVFAGACKAFKKQPWKRSLAAASLEKLFGFSYFFSLTFTPNVVGHLKTDYEDAKVELPGSLPQSVRPLPFVQTSLFRIVLQKSEKSGILFSSSAISSFQLTSGG